MSELENFKNEISKCSKCGLCQSVCPVYTITGNDCAVSRGKFVMLSGVLKGELSLTKKVVKYLDMCTKCGKCTQFCPAGIDVCKIFQAAKYDYSKKSFLSRFIFLFESRQIFNNILKIFHRICKVKSLENLSGTRNLLYFRGCADKISPKTERAFKKVFSKYRDINLIEKDFDCCGVPFLSSGNLKRYKEAKLYNIEKFNGDYECVITNCASCEDALKKYESEIEINNALDFIAQNPLKFKFKNKLKITFHKPCHLKSTESFLRILDMCENIEYIQMENFDECCGFSGEFAIHNPKLSYKMIKNKAQNILNTNADYVLTLCPACEIGLRFGLVGNKFAPKVINVIEFLSKADEISQA